MLSGYQKASLLNYVSRNRNIDFFDDRQFHGLRIRPVLSMYFDKPTEFFGKQYLEGLYEVDVSHVLGGPVEYRGPLDVRRDASGIEFHFRGPYIENAGP